MDEKLVAYKAKLGKDFPDLDIQTIQIIGSGWHHDAVEVNNAFIFRIPRGVHDLTLTVNTEVSILRRLKGKLTFDIPDPIYIAQSNKYFGYPKVQGILLKELDNEFGPNDWKRIKDDWANMASSIHKSISVSEGKSLGLPDFIEQGPSAAERIFSISNVDKEVQDFASQTIKKFKELDIDKIHYAVIHNDLQFHNILASKKTKRITGLIDWTDTCVGPLEREFAIAEWMKPGLLEEVAKLYEQKTGSKIDIEQARMWRSLEELGDYVESIESGDYENATETLERIKNLMTLEK